LPGDSPPWPHLRHQQDESAVQGSPGLSSGAASISGYLKSLFRHIRSLTSATGRSVVWTRLRHQASLHQSATTTFDDRYPELFAALAARLSPDATILSFGCSTGEELLSLRRMMPTARLTGVEINPRARRIARRLTAADPLIDVVSTLPSGPFDAVLALAVLQREPMRMIAEQVADLGRLYPFARFDDGVVALVDRLACGGFLLVFHAHYRVEDSSVADVLRPVGRFPLLDGPLFDRDSRRYDPTPPAAALFVKGDDKWAAISAPSSNS
jgi:SAM-dependent methyltransferase